MTRDGRTIAVAANIGSPEDAAAAREAGADAVGLLRTEFLFLERESPPDEHEQYAAYREIAAALGGKPVTLRTLDAGADKPLRFLGQPGEENPSLGVRGIRLALQQPEVLGAQLRAAARVAAEFPLRVAFPMVSTLAEYRAALRHVPPGLPTGIVIEVPAAALAARALAPFAAFFSLGTNDLTQYTLAADRGNPGVAQLADALHPAVLRLVSEVSAAGGARRLPVGVCGELAGDLAAVPILLGLGVTELSVAPVLVPVVKDAVRGLELRTARELAREALELASAAEVRECVARRTGESATR